jgi:hypothetical protein
MTPAEWPLFWDGCNDLFGGGFDPAGRSAALCYGRHARRSADAPEERIILDGAALNADAVIAHGCSLWPPYDETQVRKSGWKPKRKLAEELERMKLRGAVLPPDAYDQWFKWAAACKRAFPDDLEGAFQLFDCYSDSGLYRNAGEDRRKKFDQVPVEYDGSAVPVTLEMLDWRVLHRAKEVLQALYSPVLPEVTITKIQVSPLFAATYNPSDNLAVGIEASHLEETVSRVKPEDGLAALEYLLFRWTEKIHKPIIDGLKIPPRVLEEAKRRTEERREQIDLDGRVLFRWEGRNLSADTTDLANAVIDAGAPVFKVDQVLVRVSNPNSDPVHAARLRKIHKYEGPPGDKADPVKGGAYLTPVIETETIRAVIAEHIATKLPRKTGSGDKAIIVYEVGSFGFNSKDLWAGPDSGVIRDLFKRALRDRAPEITGVVTAPVMPNLPVSTLKEDLLRDGADHIITKPGYDAASGLYFAPIGTPVAVPSSPTPEHVREAAEFLKFPLLDFPFASPGENLAAGVSRSVAVYGTLVAANRRVLPLAPAFGISSHGEGMSNGKTLLAMLLTTVATGRLAIPMDFSTDFTEQGKQIVAYLLEGDGSLFLDDIVTGVRFDSKALAKVLTGELFQGRLLGVSKPVKVSTRVLVTITGCSLNPADAMASRMLLSYLDTGLERAQDRSNSNFRIPNLPAWSVEHRQEIAAAVLTLVRAYLQECKRCGGTPADVVERRKVDGSRFGGQCEFLRDVQLWAFPDLPDPFLGSHASEEASSTREEKALVLHLLDRKMLELAGWIVAPKWAQYAPGIGTIPENESDEHERWKLKAKARWDRLSRSQWFQRFGGLYRIEARDRQWGRVKTAMRIRSGRRRPSVTGPPSQVRA